MADTGDQTKPKEISKSRLQSDLAMDPDTNESGKGDEERAEKTAAQKKREKKLKQKLKAQQKHEGGEANLESASGEAPDTSAEDIGAVKGKQKGSEMSGSGTADGDAKCEDGEATGGDKEESDKKKKKKKAKKEPEEKKEPPKKGLSNKQVAAILERNRKAKEEEERLIREEEEKDKLKDQAEDARLEKLRLEQEKKERKKQKEKEKIQRLKAEGKYLTPKQRQEKQRAQAMLDALRAQGVEVPEVGKEKKPARLGTRIRPKKGLQTQTSTEEASVHSESPSNLTPSESTVDVISSEEKGPEPAKSDALEDGVKDAWDEDSDDEIKEDFVMVDEMKIEEIKDAASVTPSPHGDEKDDEEGDEDSDSESDSEDDSDSDASEESIHEPKSEVEKKKEKAVVRIQRRREENEKAKNIKILRSPVVCVLGHVDTGKTKILDKLRRTHVQDGEAGGITQQIGATNVPIDAIKEQAKLVRNFASMELKVPGLLIIDTPGHESFSNLRSRGSSLCDIAILVVDIMHGLEPQTIESINLLKAKKTPFVVALNKIDRLYDWQQTKGNKDVRDVVKSQPKNTMLEFEKRCNEVIVQFAEQGLNAALFDQNPDPKSYISMIPTSAFSGEGMGNLMALIVELSQTMLAKRLAFSKELQATVLEVKAIPGLGTTIDVILINGTLKEGDTIILAGTEGPIITQIRSLLTPQPMKELRVKNTYVEFKEIGGAIGVKIAAKDLEKAIAGLNLLVALQPDEVEICRDEVAREFKSAMNSIKVSDRGVYVQASTLGSLEALLEFLKTSEIPYAGIRIGPVVKKDVMKASIMLEHDSQYAVILAFDVKVERDAQELSDNLGVRIFQADIIYHLFDMFMGYRDELKMKKRDEFKHIAVFPCKVKILPQFIFNTRDPIVVGVVIEAGIIKEGTPLCVPTKEFVEIGRVTSIEVNHKQMETARKGQEVCIKIEPIPGETPKLLGRHFEETDILVSKITRESIDACKDYFRNDLQKSDWQLMVELKKLFQIM